jgi:hypothetical protein
VNGGGVGVFIPRIEQGTETVPPGPGSEHPPCIAVLAELGFPVAEALPFPPEPLPPEEDPPPQLLLPSTQAAASAFGVGFRAASGSRFEAAVGTGCGIESGECAGGKFAMPLAAGDDVGSGFRFGIGVGGGCGIVPTGPGGGRPALPFSAGDGPAFGWARLGIGVGGRCGSSPGAAVFSPPS